MTVTVSGVIPVDGGPIGMSSEQWAAAVEAGTITREVEQRVADAAERSRRELRTARRWMNQGKITPADYDDVRRQSAATCRRALQVGAVTER